MSASPSFGPEHNRRQAGHRQRLGARNPYASAERLALADEHQREMGQRRQVSARADRSTARHDRVNAGADERQQGVDRGDADAGVTARQHVGAQQHHRAHDAHVERRADAGRVAAQQVDLELVE